MTTSTRPTPEVLPHADGAAHLWMPYCQMKTAPPPLPVVATEDVYLILADGRRLIDGLASWWTACHGYNHPHIAEAVREQLETMPHVMMGGVHHPQALRLAKRLADTLPGDLNHVFFSDSGSVAVEVAMKMAAQYYMNRGVGGRHKFVSFRHAYHGDTTGAMSLCDPVNSMHAHFKGFLLEQFPQALPRTRSEADAFDAFIRTHRDGLAGVIIEPLIQGAGGMKFHPPETLRILRSTCDRYGLLLIADEIATGFGRTGSMWAIEQAGVVADLICLGKALTGGTMGLAATVATDGVYEAFHSDEPLHALMHGPTFMGNPLACAAANASLDLFDQEPRLQQARQMETWLRSGLESCWSIPGVVDVRCRGAVGVIQVEKLERVDQLIAECVARGVWLRPFADMIYVTPALTMRQEVVEQMCAAISEAIGCWASGRGKGGGLS